MKYCFCLTSLIVTVSMIFISCQNETKTVSNEQPSKSLENTSTLPQKSNEGIEAAKKKTLTADNQTSINIRSTTDNTLNENNVAKKLVGTWECSDNLVAMYSFEENGEGGLFMKISPDKYKDRNARVIIAPAPNSGCSCYAPIKWTLKKNKLYLLNGVSNCECKGLDKHKEELDINHEDSQGTIRFQNDNIMYLDNLKFVRVKKEDLKNKVKKREIDPLG